MTKGKRRGFDKKAAHIRAATAAVSAAAPSAAYAKKTRNRFHNEQPGNGDWNTMAQMTPGHGTTTATGMQELARNTRNNAAHWDQGSKLRDRPVVFVSGGYIEPADKAEPELPATTETACAYPSAATDTATKSTRASPCLGDDINNQVNARESSESDSDSSTEVILFRGRNNHEPAQPDRSFKSIPSITEATTGQQRHSDAPDDDGKSIIPGCLDHLIVASDDEDGSAMAMDDYITNLLLGDTQGGSACGSDEESDGNGWPDVKGISDGDDAPENNKMATDIDDEHLARLLSKQEELGLDATELILLDGNSISAQKTRKWPHQQSNMAKDSKRSGPKGASLPVRDLGRLKPRDGSYPSAEAVADAFELLQVTGWGHDHHRLELGLSDSELEAALLASWQKDGLRKRDRRKAREERRSQGLLGKNANANDARVKYPNGMSLEDIKDEFQSFLLGTDQSVTLAPMDAHARKIIHELAHRFGITSKSTGSGTQRRPTLVRKKGTPEYDASHFNGVFMRVGRRYFARLDAKQAGAGAPPKLRNSSSAAVVVRNGEIVGGSAPEIGQENKGRTMLEKMGWSVGMALGAMDNKGMTQPIEHIVKRSKAGLG